MTFAELAVWALWAVTITLTLILYIRVDLHDWGMVGMTIFFFGATVLLTRSVLRMTGNDTDPDIITIWRALVLIGAPLAIAGYGMGIYREPPPWKQVVRRLAVLALVTVATVIVIEG